MDYYDYNTHKIIKDVEVKKLPLCQICLGSGEIPVIMDGSKRFICKYCDENEVWE